HPFSYHLPKDCLGSSTNFFGQTAARGAHLHQRPRLRRQLALVECLIREKIELSATGFDGSPNGQGQENGSRPEVSRQVGSPPHLVDICLPGPHHSIKDGHRFAMSAEPKQFEGTSLHQTIHDGVMELKVERGAEHAGLAKAGPSSVMQVDQNLFTYLKVGEIGDRFNLRWAARPGNPRFQGPMDVPPTIRAQTLEVSLPGRGKGNEGSAGRLRQFGVYSGGAEGVHEQARQPC